MGTSGEKEWVRPANGATNGMCRHCLEVRDFVPGRGFCCIDCNRGASKLYYYNNHEAAKAMRREYGRLHPSLERKRAYWRRLREEVINHYGGVCVCCGEDEIVFLALDHVNDDGAEHRRKVGSNIYSWIRSHGFPEGFQVLCSNCNWAKHSVGICPHQEG